MVIQKLTYITNFALVLQYQIVENLQSYKILQKNLKQDPVLVQLASFYYLW